MHVCFICNEYPSVVEGGGLGTFTKLMAKYLLYNGHNVTVIGVYKNIRRKKVFYDNDTKIICLPYRKVPKFHWEFNRWLLARFIEREHKKTQFDIIEFPDYQGWLRKIKVDVPVIIRLNAPEKVGLTEGIKVDNLPFDIKSESKSIKYADYIIGSSKAVINAAKKTYLNTITKHKKIKLIYNGIELPDINLAQENEKIILFAGRLIKKKGVYELVKAWNFVGKKHPQYKLIMVGGDSINENGSSVLSELKGLSDSNSLKNIEFIGQLNLENLRKLFIKSEICIFPSHTEAFSMVILDSLAHGKPTIYSKIDPAYEIIEHGKNGLLCDPHSSSDISKNILQLIENKDLRERVSFGGRGTIQNKFSIEKIGKDNISYFNECKKEYQNS